LNLNRNKLRTPQIFLRLGSPYIRVSLLDEDKDLGPNYIVEYPIVDHKPSKKGEEVVRCADGLGRPSRAELNSAFKQAYAACINYFKKPSKKVRVLS
jgi:hypothetical protein